MPGLQIPVRRAERCDCERPTRPREQPKPQARAFQSLSSVSARPCPGAPAGTLGDLRRRKRVGVNSSSTVFISYRNVKKIGLRQPCECKSAFVTFVSMRTADSRKREAPAAPGPREYERYKGMSLDVPPACSGAGEPEATASSSGSPRSSLRTTSARIDHETILVVVAFLLLPFARS